MTKLSDEMIALSDEYVLGLMSQGEAELFEEIMARDEEVACRVGALRDRLLPLDLSASPRDLPEDFTARVHRAIAAQGQQEADPAAMAANMTRPPARSFRRVIAAALVGLAVGFGFGFGGGWLRPMPEPVVVAVLLDAQGVPQAVVEDFGNDTATVRFVTDIDVPADRSLQVWTLPSEDMGPVSLGVLEGTRAARLAFGDLPDPGAEQLYEVTLEPQGGSPTGRPTGPIIGKGLAAPQL